MREACWFGQIEFASKIFVFFFCNLTSKKSTPVFQKGLHFHFLYQFGAIFCNADFPANHANFQMKLVCTSTVRSSISPILCFRSEIRLGYFKPCCLSIRFRNTVLFIQHQLLCQMCYQYCTSNSSNVIMRQIFNHLIIVILSIFLVGLITCSIGIGKWKLMNFTYITGQ